MLPRFTFNETHPPGKCGQNGAPVYLKRFFLLFDILFLNLKAEVTNYLTKIKAL